MEKGQCEVLLMDSDGESESGSNVSRVVQLDLTEIRKQNLSSSKTFAGGNAMAIGINSDQEFQKLAADQCQLEEETLKLKREGEAFEQGEKVVHVDNQQMVYHLKMVKRTIKKANKHLVDTEKRIKVAEKRLRELLRRSLEVDDDLKLKEEQVKSTEFRLQQSVRIENEIKKNLEEMERQTILASGQLDRLERRKLQLLEPQ